MAQQEGVIKLKGKMGGLSFYKTKSGFHVRTKGGISAERIKNDPAFERTRENGAEFGRAGAAAKLLRTALRTLIVKSADSRMANRLTRQMLKVIQTDQTNLRGQRTVVQGKLDLIQGFEFNNNGKLGSMLFMPFTASIDREQGTAKIDLEAFIPAQHIQAPQGTTHCKLIAAVLEIDFSNDQYLLATAQSELIVMGQQNQEAINLETALNPESTKPWLLAFGIEFYQEVNGQWYPLKNGAFNALALLKVDLSA